MNKSPETVMELNSSITEFDIKSANTSLMRYYGLASDNIISKLEKLPKEKREVAVGLLCQKDKQLSKNLNDAFDEIVKEFIIVNHLDDAEILTIKKDAVFVINRDDIKNDFGPVVFVPKNRYTDFMKIGNFEFYLNENVTNVKGLQKSAHKHTDGILYLIRDVISVCNKTLMNMSVINTYLADLALSYKLKQLDFAMYREFNQDSMFSVYIDGERYLMDSIDESYLDDLDIHYNYLNIILPLIRTLMK